MHTVPFSDPKHAFFFLSVIYVTKSSFIGSYRPPTKFAKVMFLHVSVILSMGWVVVVDLCQHALQVSRPTPGGEVEGSGWGVSRPTHRGKLRGLARGGLQAHTGGYPSMPCRSPGPHPEGRLRGLAGVGSPGPHPGGKLRVWPGGSPGPHRGGGLQAHTRGGVYPSMH